MWGPLYTPSVLKIVPASQEDPQLSRHTVGVSVGSPGAQAQLLFLSSDATAHQSARIMRDSIDTLLFGHWSLLVLGPCVLP